MAQANPMSPTFYTHTNEQLRATQEATSMEPSTPALPERAARRSEDVGRAPSSSESRRYWRSSEQPGNLRPAASGAGNDRPSDDGPPQFGPHNQQIMQWQPPHAQDEYSEDQDPSPPRDYYLVPRGLNPTAAPYPSPSSSNEGYGPRPYRRMVRESNETHRPLVSEQAGPRRRPSVRPQWDDGYDEEPQRPTPKRMPQKSKTGIYVVREGGGDGGDGSEGEIMRLPFSNWMQGTVKNRKSWRVCENYSRLTWHLSTDFIAVLGEFVGTTMFLFFAFVSPIPG